FPPLNPRELLSLHQRRFRWSIRLELRVTQGTLLPTGTTGANPVLLDQIVSTTQRDVVVRTVAGGVGSAVGVGALIAILFAVPKVPGIQIGIGSGLLSFMRDD